MDSLIRYEVSSHFEISFTLFQYFGVYTPTRASITNFINEVYDFHLNSLSFTISVVTDHIIALGPYIPSHFLLSVLLLRLGVCVIFGTQSFYLKKGFSLVSFFNNRSAPVLSCSILNKSFLPS